MNLEERKREIILWIVSFGGLQVVVRTRSVCPDHDL